MSFVVSLDLFRDGYLIRLWWQELLALEERIGNVSTGLSEDAIMRSIIRRKHLLFVKESSHHPEPCCVCQVRFISGSSSGTKELEV